jgi:hypothetical protein
MSVRGAAPIVVSQATNMAINGYIIVAVATPNVDLPIEQISINLHYDPQEGDGDSIAADPPVVLNNTNATQTSWPHPHNCQELTLDRLTSQGHEAISSYPKGTRAKSPWPIARGPTQETIADACGCPQYRRHF